jgi:hypothetical protein
MEEMIYRPIEVQDLVTELKSGKNVRKTMPVSILPTLKRILMPVIRKKPRRT